MTVRGARIKPCVGDGDGVYLEESAVNTWPPHRNARFASIWLVPLADTGRLLGTNLVNFLCRLGCMPLDAMLSSFSLLIALCPSGAAPQAQLRKTMGGVLANTQVPVIHFDGLPACRLAEVALTARFPYAPRPSGNWCFGGFLMRAERNHIGPAFGRIDAPGGTIPLAEPRDGGLVYTDWGFGISIGKSDKQTICPGIVW